MTLLKAFFVFLVVYFILRASRNLMLAARQNPSKLSGREASSRSERNEDSEQRFRHQAPHEVVEDAQWEDL